MTEPLAAVFRKPFAEQVAALRLRLGDLVPTARWDDIEKSAHDRAFMVAGAMKADLLADMAGAVDKSIASGTSLEEFRADFRNIVAKHGWHGWTGEGTKKGEAWRTRVIYKTNAATTYAAGRMAQLAEGKFDFWVYRHGGSLEPRIQHLGWDGLILPPDHPFWQTHAPPNGWGCSCYIIGARSIAGAKRVGGNPDIKLPPDWQKLNPRTGAPEGIDRGWDYAPGASVTDIVSALAPKLNMLPESPSIDLIQSWLQSVPFERWFAAPVGNWPMVRISEPDAVRIGSVKTIAELSAKTAIEQIKRHPELSVFDYAKAQAVVSNATRVIQDGASSLIYVLETPGANGHILVVKATWSGAGLFVTSFRRFTGSETERARRLRQLLRKVE